MILQREPESELVLSCSQHTFAGSGDRGKCLDKMSFLLTTYLLYLCQSVTRGMGGSLLFIDKES